MSKTYNQTLAKDGREYNYGKTFMFPKETLGDLCLLIGAESLCRLIHFFGSCYIYVPAKKSVKRQIMEAALLMKFEQLRKMGQPRELVIDSLHEDFKEFWTRSSIEQKIAKWNGKRITAVKRAARETLLQEVKKNIGTFEQYGLL